MRAARAAAIALALSVSALAAGAAAQTAEVPAPPPAETSTPLALRPSKPLEVMREPAPIGVGWKIFAGLVVVAGAAAFARKRFGPGAAVASGLRIVRRTPVGLRSELLIVEVEGQRLLLGVTAGGIQHLASLEPSPEAEVGAALQSRAPLAERFGAMLDAADRRPVAPRPAANTVGRALAAVEDESIPGQARGLLRLGKR